MSYQSQLEELNAKFKQQDRIEQEQRIASAEREYQQHFDHCGNCTNGNECRTGKLLLQHIRQELKKVLS